MVLQRLLLPLLLLPLASNSLPKMSFSSFQICGRGIEGVFGKDMTRVYRRANADHMLIAQSRELAANKTQAMR